MIILHEYYHYFQTHENEGERFTVLLDRVIHSASEGVFEQLPREAGQTSFDNEESNLCVHHLGYWLPGIINCIYLRKHIGPYQTMSSRKFLYTSTTTFEHLNMVDDIVSIYLINIFTCIL